MSNGTGTLFLLDVWEMVKYQLKPPTRKRVAKRLWQWAQDEDCDLHNLEEIEKFAKAVE